MARNQRIQKRIDKCHARRTGSHPTVASNPPVLQPGLLPVRISLMPSQYKPASYSQLLRNPSDGLPLETRRSLSIAIMAAAVCTLEFSPVHEDGQRTTEGGKEKTHVRREARAAHRRCNAIPDDCIFHRLHGDVGDAAVQRAKQIT